VASREVDSSFGGLSLLVDTLKVSKFIPSLCLVLVDCTIAEINAYYQQWNKVCDESNEIRIRQI
jgi:hypothetical protein